MILWTAAEMSVLKFLKSHPDARQEDIAAHIGKSVSTVKRITPELMKISGNTPVFRREMKAPKLHSRMFV